MSKLTSGEDFLEQLVSHFGVLLLGLSFESVHLETPMNVRNQGVINDRGWLTLFMSAVSWFPLFKNTFPGYSPVDGKLVS